MLEWVTHDAKMKMKQMEEEQIHRVARGRVRWLRKGLHGGGQGGNGGMGGGDGIQDGVQSRGENFTLTKYEGRWGEATNFGDAYNGRT